MNQIIKDYFDRLVEKSNQKFVWGRTKDEFLNKTNLEIISQSECTSKLFDSTGSILQDEVIPNNEVTITFRLSTQKWVNSHIPWVSKETFIIKKDEWRDLKLKSLLNNE